jgi:putative DNA methylase
VNPGIITRALTTYKKKLIEVALPLEAINRESAREKSIRHGHPSTLHLWWARRPLAACRAVLFASLVDDPSSHPDRFPTEEAQDAERQRLFRIIERLVKWENSTNEEVLTEAREEILRSCDGRPPPVLDPFCGGGSIPLEAQRLGLEAHASDLNPVAVLITKALIEIPPKFAGRPPVNPASRDNPLKTWRGAQGLADDVRYYGRWMRDEAERRICHLYPKVRLPAEHGGGEATVIAWIWARTVPSPSPAWDGPMPLVRSFALSTKPGREVWAEPVVDRKGRRIRFEIRHGRGWPEGTVSRNGARCLASGTAVPLSYVRAEGRAGRMGAQLMAIVAQGKRGRIYVAPDPEHVRIAREVVSPEGVAETEMPAEALGFRVQNYGMTRHRDLFTARQLMALRTFSDLVLEGRQQAVADGADEGYASGLATYLGLASSRCADYWSAMTSWHSSGEFIRNTFPRQALPMVWDFTETNGFSSSTGNWWGAIDWISKAVDRLTARPSAAVRQADAAIVRSPCMMVSTDPPYYDNVPYADLSDFFYVWLRRSLFNDHPSLFRTLLVPKAEEIVASPTRFGGDKRAAERHFEEGLALSFGQMRAFQDSGYPLTIYYAFKQAEDREANGQVASTGWETMLQGLLQAAFMINGTWPIRSELGNRTRSQDSNALASSIVLVCRPRPATAGVTTRKSFRDAIKRELPAALRNLQQGNIAPVDLAQAAIGPGMSVFSRHAKVLEADGSAMTVRTALGLINRVLDETLSEQEGDFDPETRWAVAWFEQNGTEPGRFGDAETLSRAKNTAPNALEEAGVIDLKGGRVKLRSREDLNGQRNPEGPGRQSVWLATQRLVAAHEREGNPGAAGLVRQMGGLSGVARELAYRLFAVCERKKWAREALSYNALVVAWPDIMAMASKPEGHGQLTLETP